MMRMAWAAALVALATWPAVADAQEARSPPPGAGRWAHAQKVADLKRAEENFRQGLDDEQAGAWDKALAEFGLARTLARKETPQLLYHLGICHAWLGNVVAARDELAKAAARAVADGRADLATLIKAELADVQPRIASLVLTRPTQVEVTAVTIDGVEATGKLGTGVELDPGAHRIHATYADAPPGDANVTLRDGELRVLALPEPGSAPEPPPPSAPPPARPPPVAVAPEPVHVAPAEPAASSGVGTQRIYGLAVGGAGLTGVGVGAVFLLLSHAASSQPQHDNAATDSTVSTAWFIAGGALLATGAVLFLTGGSHEIGTAEIRALPSVGPGQAGVALEGVIP
jgi:hypothetical protein